MENGYLIVQVREAGLREFNSPVKVSDSVLLTVSFQIMFAMSSEEVRQFTFFLFLRDGFINSDDF